MHIGSMEAQKLATRGLRFVDGHVLWGDKPTKNRPRPKNSVRILVTPKPKDEYAHLAVEDKTKYIRILKREIRGKSRYFVQLIQEGYPPSKKNRVQPTDPTQRVGLDIGTSTVAICSEHTAELRELAPECQLDEQKLRVLQRKMDRSKRATNPQNFNRDGTVKKGRLTWMYSNRYQRLRHERKECYRNLALQRKMAHERLVNHILSLGRDIRVETMRFQSLQKRAKQTTRNRHNHKINRKKRFGKSIGNRAPSMLLTIMERKLSYEGTSLKKIDTYAVKASQFNHITNQYTRKPLSERWNRLDNQFIQRDLYSAFLICHTNETLDSVDTKRCQEHWQSFVQHHHQEVKRLKMSSSHTLRWFVA